MSKFGRIMTCGIYLLLGSNLGDKLTNLQQAKLAIAEIATIVQESSIYETAAWGNTDQPSFYNQVIEVCSTLAPRALLHHLLDIEKQLGRVRFEKWGARTIDIDILYYENWQVEEHDLIIPHPGIAQRKFTLIPLNEIAPNHIHMITGLSHAEMLQALADDLTVTKI